MRRFTPLAVLLMCCLTSAALAADLESFDFGDANDTPLTAAVNTANPGNFWFYDEEATTPGSGATGDISTVQSGSYRVITDSSFATGLDSRFLDIPNTSSGTVYLSSTFSSWNFSAYDGSTAEQVRFTFLDDDTGISGSTVTSQMQIRRNTTTGSMELFGDAIGTAGSFNIANTIDLPDSHAGPFTVVMALDKDSSSFEVFYKDGANPSQSLGLGGVSRIRDANSIRMVTNNFGAENFLPFVITEEVNVDRIAISDTNPLADLITLEVNRLTGSMTLKNTSGATVSNIDSLSLQSATGSIDLTDFLDFNGNLGIGQDVSLDASPGSAPGVWLRTPTEDLSAELVISGGDARTLDVNFVGNGGLKWVTGDLDYDGAIDADDYDILTANAESNILAFSLAQAYQVGDLNGDNKNDVVDFTLFKNAFIAENGELAFSNLIAGIPEPGTASLMTLVLLSLGLRRRRPAGQKPFPYTSNTMRKHPSAAIALTAIVAIGLLTNPAEAVIFEDYQFNDVAGTLITGAVNSANSGVFLDEDADTVDVMTNGLGQLNASLKSNTAFGTNYVDVDPGITTGTIYGVMELTWDFQSALDTAENEEIRLSLTNNDPRGSEITGEFRIVRNDSNQLIINGQAGGTGSSDLPDTILNGGSLVQSDKFVAVVAADLDNSTYEILYSNNAGSSFLSAGTGNSSPGRIVEAMRMTLNNDLSNDNVLIDRFYLTDTLPFVVDPDKLTLLIDPKSGFASIINDTGTAFDIDHYRILSNDSSLLESNWNSLQDQATDAIDGADPGSTVGDGVGETWTEAGGSGPEVLSESFLLSSSVITGSEAPISLGRIFDLNGDDQQLTFEYRDAENGNVFAGVVLVASGLPGDYNLDGSVDAADYTVWRDNESGNFVQADYTVWANNFGATWLSPSESTAIPEPTAIVIALLAIAMPIARRR